MATTIQIKRTTGTALPASMAEGELVYVGGIGGDGQKLYIGDPTSATPVTIGGEYFMNLLDHTAGTLTADSAVIVDANSAIDIWNVDNIRIDGNVISSTDANGNININPNGTGSSVIFNPYVDAVTAGEATDMALEDYVKKFGGKTVVTQDGLNNVVDALVDPPTVTIGIDDLGIANIKLANDGITIGSTDMSLGETHTDLVGLTSVVVDNVTIDGNAMSTTAGNLFLTPFTGIIDSAGSIVPSAGSTYDLGSASNKWQTLYVDGAAFSDVTVGVDAVNAIGTSAGDLVIGSTSGTIDMQGSVTVSGTHNVQGAGQYQTTLQVMGDFTAAANATVIGNTSLTGNLSQVTAGGGTVDFGGVGGDTVGTVTGSWTVDQLSMDAGTLSTTTGDMILDSAGLVQSDSHFIPTIDSDGVTGYDLGSVTNKWRNLYASSSSFGNVRIAGADDQTIDTTAGDLVLDSFTGETVMNDNFTVNGTTDLVGVTTVTGDTTVTGNTVLDGDTTLNTGAFVSNATSNTFANVSTFTLAVQMNDSLRVDDVSIDSNIIATVGIGSDLLLDPNTDGSGNGNVLVDSHVIPNVDDTYDLGSLTNKWRNLYAGSSTFGNIQIAVTDDQTIDTAAGDLVLDSFTGITTMNDDVTVSGTFTSTGAATMSSTLGVTGATTLSDTLGVTGATTLSSTLSVTGATTLTGQLDANGDVNLGSAATNTVTFVADVDSNILPSVDGSDGIAGFDLGSPTDMWRNIYAANGYITIGTDQVLLGATITDVNGLTSLDVDTMTLDSNIISTTLTDQDLSLEPNGQGTVVVPSGYELRTGFQDNSLVTKYYVDQAIQGLDAKESVKAATTGNITLSAHGIIDGVTLASGDRVLVKDQTTTSENGIYVSDGTGLTRAEDANLPNEIDGGTFVFVEGGTVNAFSGWVTTHVGEPVIDTDPITWAQFSGAGQIEAGAAMTKTGNTLDVAVDNSTIEVTADALNVMDLGILNQHIADTTIDLTAKVTNLLPTTNGGTGLLDPALNSLLVGSGTNPMTELASAGTTVGYLLQNDATGAPVWDNVINGGTY